MVGLSLTVFPLALRTNALNIPDGAPDSGDALRRGREVSGFDFTNGMTDFLEGSGEMRAKCGPSSGDSRDQRG